MGSFTTLYDAVVTRVGVVLPSYSRLPNPYKIEENTELFLKKGWGLAMGGASNTNRELSCRISIRRDFTISLTQKFLSLESAVSQKVAIEQALVEDQILLIRDICMNEGVPDSTGIVEYSSDGGIEYVYNGKDNFLALRTTFTAEYFQTI